MRVSLLTFHPITAAFRVAELQFDSPLLSGWTIMLQGTRIPSLISIFITALQNISNGLFCGPQSNSSLLDFNT